MPRRARRSARAAATAASTRRSRARRVASRRRPSTDRSPNDPDPNPADAARFDEGAADARAASSPSSARHSTYALRRENGGEPSTDRSASSAAASAFAAAAASARSSSSFRESEPANDDVSVAKTTPLSVESPLPVFAADSSRSRSSTTFALVFFSSDAYPRRRARHDARGISRSPTRRPPRLRFRDWARRRIARRAAHLTRVARRGS